MPGFYISMYVGLLLRGEEGELHSKKDIIMTARQIVKESEEIVKMARIVANSCTDKRLKRVSVVCLTKFTGVLWCVGENWLALHSVNSEFIHTIYEAKSA